MDKGKITIKQLPVSERPYEKCKLLGAEALSDAELLAVIIRSGTKNANSLELARSILMLSENNKGLLGINYISESELMSIKGIGKVKAIQILCIAELTKRMARSTRDGGIYFNTPDSVAEYYMQEMRHLSVEEIHVLMLDTKSKFIKDIKISIGTVNSSILTPREVFLAAFKCSAVNIILIHNHPSGDPLPSKEDITSTKRIKEAGILIGIKLMDHIIIGDNKYVSMKEIGIL